MPPRSRTRRRRRSGFRRLHTLVHARLVRPLRSIRHAPEHTARGVGIGLLVALTPTVGAQMAIVVAIWIVIKRLRPAWDFNVVIAAAWTWVTNVFTVPPVYYLYVLTGRLMLGRIGEHHGYGEFASRLAESFGGQAGWLESVWIYVLAVFEKFGVPLFVGCVPYAVVGSWVGYRWSLRVVRDFRARRARRRAAHVPLSD